MGTNPHQLTTQRAWSSECAVTGNHAERIARLDQGAVQLVAAVDPGVVADPPPSTASTCTPIWRRRLLRSIRWTSIIARLSASTSSRRHCSGLARTFTWRSRRSPRWRTSTASSRPNRRPGQPGRLPEPRLAWVGDAGSRRLRYRPGDQSQRSRGLVANSRLLSRSPWAGRRSLRGRAVVDGVVTNPLHTRGDHGVAIAGCRRLDDVESVKTDSLPGQRDRERRHSVVRIRTARGLEVTCALRCARPSSASRGAIEGTGGRATFAYTADRVTTEVAGQGRTETTTRWICSRTC